MTIKEGDEVRLRVGVTGIRGTTVPAGTVGVVVDDVHAPGQYAVDIEINGAYDNVAVTGDQVEPATSAEDRSK